MTQDDQASVEISHETEAQGGSYIAHVSGADAMGRMTYKIKGDQIRVVEHTLVPPQIGGRGVAARLVDAIVADAKEQGFRIDPQCSYVEAAFRKHPEWADIRA
ncbi:GNAT family N-acetyltransferase [Croceicoccus sp. F390]|uniref:GNAT family N-acetyltransferase n=1 Tax=Croceicoccus esteveae TaxID=3075597 RepID=A0ABU2ZJF4_9SPHN|nr:GNAT family N-acetyltransferase [Croceicoccus sp. F390]MDT0576733.1 GNAT family N-acetyltransferase [Croceicoccus sp. F390]